MKSVLVENTGKEPKNEYPVLKHNGSLVVLFTEPKTGVVVHSPGYNYPVGDYSSKWNESMFDTLDGEVKLSNN